LELTGPGKELASDKESLEVTATANSAAKVTSESRNGQARWLAPQRASVEESASAPTNHKHGGEMDDNRSACPTLQCPNLGYPQSHPSASLEQDTSERWRPAGPQAALGLLAISVSWDSEDILVPAPRPSRKRAVRRWLWMDRSIRPVEEKACEANAFPIRKTLAFAMGILPETRVSAVASSIATVAEVTHEARQMTFAACAMNPAHRRLETDQLAMAKQHWDSS